MHRCPECDYAFGPMPGVPGERFGAYTAAVRCPECAVEVDAGTLVLAGGRVAGAVQPFTPRRRLRGVALAALPVAACVITGLRGLGRIASGGVSSARATDLLMLLALPMPFVVARLAWKHWSPSDADGRALAAREIQWLCTRGTLSVRQHGLGEVHRSGKVEPWWRRLPSGSPEWTLHSRDWAGRNSIEVRDIRSVRVHAATVRGGTPAANERAVARIVANSWVTAKDGRRKDMASWQIHVDVCDEGGAAVGGAAPDRMRATLDAGERVAAVLREAIGLRGAAMPPDGAALEIEGSPRCRRPWPEPRNIIAAIMVLPMAITGIIGFIGLVALGDAWLWPAHPLLARRGDPRAFVTAAAAVANAAMLAVPLLWWYLVRRARRLETMRCRWRVEPGALRVIEVTCDRRGTAIAEAARDVPASAVAAVTVTASRLGLRIVAADAAGRELAGIAPDAFPVEGADALAARVGAILRA